MMLVDTHLVQGYLEQRILPPLQLCHCLLYACQALLMLLDCSILHDASWLLLHSVHGDAVLSTRPPLVLTAAFCPKPTHCAASSPCSSALDMLRLPVQYRVSYANPHEVMNCPTALHPPAESTATCPPT